MRVCVVGGEEGRTVRASDQHSRTQATEEAWQSLHPKLNTGQHRHLDTAFAPHQDTYIQVPQASQGHGGPRQQEVPRKNRQLVPKHEIHRAHPATGVRHVNDIIMQQGRGVDHFPGHDNHENPVRR
jgi:hypothetical protein